MKKLKGKKGFTLMEMLVVIAIIAVLVTILVPSIGASLRKAKEAADVANIRAAYAQYQIAFIEGTVGLDIDVDYSDHSNVSIFVKDSTGDQFRAKLNYPDMANVNKSGDPWIMTYVPEEINGKNTYTWQLPKP